MVLLHLYFARIGIVASTLDFSINNVRKFKPIIVTNYAVAWTTRIMRSRVAAAT